MHSCMFLSLVDASLDGLHIYFVLVNASLLGVGWRGGLSSHIFTPAFWRIWHMPIFLGFLQGISHLGYFLALNSQLCPIWLFDLGLHSVLEVPFLSKCLQLFWRGFQSGQQFLSFLRNLASLSCLIYLGVSTIVSGSLAVWPFIWRRFCGIFFVSKTIWGTTLLRPSKSAPCLLFSSSRDEEGFGGPLPFSLAGFWG